MEEPTDEPTAEPFSAIRAQILTFLYTAAIKALTGWAFLRNW